MTRFSRLLSLECLSLIAGCSLVAAPALSGASLDGAADLEARYSSHHHHHSGPIGPVGPTGATGATGATGPLGDSIAASSSRYSFDTAFGGAGSIPFAGTVAINDKNFEFSTPNGVDTLTALVAGRYVVTAGVNTGSTGGSVGLQVYDSDGTLSNTVDFPCSFSPLTGRGVIIGSTFDITMDVGDYFQIFANNDFALVTDAAGRSVILEIGRIGD